MASDSSRPGNERRRYTRVRMLPETHTVPRRAEKGGGSNARCHHMKLQTFGPIYGCPVERPAPAVGAELLRSCPGGGAPRPIALSRSVCSSRRNGSRSSAARRPPRSERGPTRTLECCLPCRRLTVASLRMMPCALIPLEVNWRSTILSVVSNRGQLEVNYIERRVEKHFLGLDFLASVRRYKRGDLNRYANRGARRVLNDVRFESVSIAERHGDIIVSY